MWVSSGTCRAGARCPSMTKLFHTSGASSAATTASLVVDVDAPDMAVGAAALDDARRVGVAVAVGVGGGGGGVRKMAWTSRTPTPSCTTRAVTLANLRVARTTSTVMSTSPLRDVLRKLPVTLSGTVYPRLASSTAHAWYPTQSMYPPWAVLCRLRRGGRKGGGFS